MSDDRQPAVRRRRAGLRSLGIATAAAFAGGVAVVGVQYALSLVSAGYPPVVQGLFCAADDNKSSGVALGTDSGLAIPVAEFPVGALVSCRIDAPGADYATWSVLGPASATRSGLLDLSRPCQSSENFVAQDPAALRLSACQQFQATRPGMYLLSVTVLLRGHQAVDRVRMLVRVAPPPEPPPPPVIPRHERLSVVLRLPSAEVEQARQADLSASFGEHGLTPQTRHFQRTVYTLKVDETFAGAEFRPRSAANASAVTLAYAPKSRSVTASFSLRAGSFLDRWRGWLSGTVEVRVRGQQPAREIALTDAELAVPGQAELDLPEGLDASAARIVLRRTESNETVEVAPGGTATLDAARITAHVRDGRLLLRAEPP